MKISSLLLGSSISMILMSSAALAAPIVYTFSGTGSGTLDGTSFTSFTLTLDGDTSNITSGGGEYGNIVSSATVLTDTGSDTLTGNYNEVVVNVGSFPAIGFEQAQPPPTYAVAEALENSALASYDLSTAYPSITGTLSFGPATYETQNGGFTLNTLSSLSFEATGGVSAAPEPSTWALMLSGLAIIGGILRSARRRSIFATA